MNRMQVFSILLAMMWVSMVTTGCGPQASGAVAVQLPTVASLPVPPQAISPVNGPRPLNPVPSATPTEAPAAPFYACGAGTDIVSHQVHAALDYDLKTIAVEQAILIPNRASVLLNGVVLDVQPNVWDGAFTLERVSIGGVDQSFHLDRNTLTVALAEPLPPACDVALDLAFRLDLPPISSGFLGQRGYFGYSPRQMNLANWLPTVAPLEEDNWRIHEPSRVGEYTVLEQADWDLTLEATAPANLILAAPGVVAQSADNQWTVRHPRSRELALSLSPDFRVNQAVSAEGVTLETYTFSDAVATSNGRPIDGAAHMLQVGIDAIQAFTRAFGPQPYDRMVVVQGDFPDGMEFSGLVFVATAWFASFDGGHRNYLTLITAHELAHQWWYASVGSDSATTPWLDEALATYSESVYLEAAHPELVDWWWGFRVAYYNPGGALNRDVYAFTDLREYINAIYLRGAQFLQNVRDVLGDELFYAWLRAYADQRAGQIAAADDLWRALGAESFERISQVLSAFFEPVPQYPVQP
jgi:hypothetical protein